MSCPYGVWWGSGPSWRSPPLRFRRPTRRPPRPPAASAFSGPRCLRRGSGPGGLPGWVRRCPVCRRPPSVGPPPARRAPGAGFRLRPRLCPACPMTFGRRERTGPPHPCSVTIRWWGRCPGAVPMTWQGERLLLPVGRAMSVGQSMRVVPGVLAASGVLVAPVGPGVSCSGRRGRLPSPGRPPTCLPRPPRLTAGPSPPFWATGPWFRRTWTYSAPPRRVPGPPPGPRPTRAGPARPPRACRSGGPGRRTGGR